MKAALIAIAAAVAFVALYALAALAFAEFPRAGRPVAQDAAFVDAFVCATAVHTDIVLPLRDREAEWRRLFGEATQAAPDTAYLAIGWGDYGFYHDTPTWADLRAATVLRALFGLGPTTIHVRAVRRPTERNPCVRLHMDQAGDDALLAFVTASTVLDASGRAVPLEAVEPGEAFYAAQGRYGPFHTCNAWASKALAAAGQPTALFAPFSFGVTWPLRRGPPREP